MQIFNRKSKELEEEKVCAEKLLRFLYSKSGVVHLIAPLFPFFSKLYALFMKSRFSKYKIAPFIKEFQIDSAEFALPVEKFSSFNDFFIRKLKKEARPIIFDPEILVSPADGRCLVYPNLEKVENFFVKGNSFNLSSFLQNEELASLYRNGSMLLLRLAPSDYHRFHFPVDCYAHPSKLINGTLFSVNPIALFQHPKILWENKRFSTLLETTYFDKILFVEVGATLVGSINEAYLPEEHYQKGEEKGYFSFGGSTIVLLFEEGKIQFDVDLLQNSKEGIETKINFGESVGRVCK